MEFPVIPAVTGGRHYWVRSKSEPGKRHVVNLAKATCTCIHSKYLRGKDQLCEHQQLAVAFEQEQAEMQANMPYVTAELRTQVTGQKHIPKVAGMTQDELLAIFS